mgnify:CR=1 FL=1
MLVKMNRMFPGFSDDFWGRDYYPTRYNSNGFKSVPAVNIAEGENEFTIEVAAPGFNKKDFKIDLDNDKLTIASAKEAKENSERYTRREFNFNEFSRTFTLPETVDGEKITAKHRDGILYVSIPKKEEAWVKPAREIAIK